MSQPDACSAACRSLIADREMSANEIREQLRRGQFYVTPGGLKHWPAVDKFNAFLQEADEMRAAIDGYIEAVLAHEDVNAAYDEGMGLWPEQLQRAKQAEQEAYERLYALSKRSREVASC